MTADSSGAPAWEARFRAGHVSLPDWAQDAPDRACVVATHDGVRQVHSYDVGTGALAVATNRPAGTTDASISADGAWLWWFDDDAGDEHGVWRRQAFGTAPDGGASGVETPLDLPAAYSAGLLLGPGETVVTGSSDDDGTRVHAFDVGASPTGTPAAGRLLYSHEEDAGVAALSHDGAWVAIEHSERGDNRHPALRVLRVADGGTVADLDDGEGLGLGGLAFAPRDGDPRLLVQHERSGRPELLVWDVGSGATTLLDLGLPGDVADADWFPDGEALLVAVDHEARTRLYRHDLATRATTPVGPTDGTVSSAGVRPDGDVWFGWSSAAAPRSVRSARTDAVLLAAPGEAAPASVDVEDVWVDGPGGRVHALLRRPAGVARDGGPLPVVVEVHGGPTWHESDSFAPDLAAWVDHGFAVLTVNYRGSTGYGSAWRDALEAKVGFTELEDVAAVHAALVEQGVLDPARSVLAGASWGGYLTLLGLGTQPERWTLGVAGVPLADYVAAYEDEMEGLKAFDRSLFGGSPQEVPEAYRVSSPLTYSGDVVAPLLVLAGENDPRCPIRQVENYLAAIETRDGAPTVETYRYEAGHGSYADDERIAQMRVQLDFVLRHVAV